jgi:hypothetical protein
VANDFYTKFAGMRSAHRGNARARSGVHAPGLIESHDRIALTGPNPEDFTLTLTTTTLRDPASHNMCTLFAGYLSKDITGAGSRGDLCVWDVERYYRMPALSELPNSMFAGSSPTSYESRVRSVAGVDHERDPNKTYASNWLNMIANPYSQPANFDLGVTAAGMAPYGTDFHRTLYSLKNLTTSTELRTFPGCPSGVSAAYYIPPTDATNQITLFGTASYYYHNFAILNSGVTRYDFHITTDASWTPTLSGGDTLVYHIAPPWSFTCMTQGGMIAAPMHSRARFLKADMTTLSFVMKFEVGTVAWETQTIPADTNGVDTTGIDRKFYHHPAIAIWTFNELRDTFFPSTMPEGYVAPSSHYTEPSSAQVGVKQRLNTIISEDFRTAHMAGNTWTLMGLGALPPGQSDDTWGSQDMAMLRYYVLGTDCMDNTNLRSAFQTAFDYGPVRNTDASLVTWFYALGVFGSPVCLALTATPKFHWAMYSDLITNSIAVNPLTCFFVHPNGTYAYFDVTHFYNRNGLMFGTRSSYTDSVTWWDATKVEHWIVDKVHLSFQLPKGRTEKETSFVDLYNDAVDALQPPPVTEPFTRLQTSDLQATVTKLATGTVSIDGLSLQITWGGHTYVFSEDSVRGTTDAYYAIGNSGTIDWSLDYLFGGVVPQLAHPHLTFSSCCLVEDMLSG